MPARRFRAFALLIFANLALLDGPTAGQGNPKAAPKPKPGAPLLADPNGPAEAGRAAQHPHPGPEARTPEGRPLVDDRDEAAPLVPDDPRGQPEWQATGHRRLRRDHPPVGRGHRGLRAGPRRPRLLRCYGLAWSPDGNYLASAGSFNATARVWEAKSGLCVRVLKGHKGYVSHVAWSPDGTRLLTAGGTSGSLPSGTSRPANTRNHRVRQPDLQHRVRAGRRARGRVGGRRRARTSPTPARSRRSTP